MDWFKPSYNLVRFSDDTYGVLRTFWFSKTFVDLITPVFEWTPDANCFRDCKGSEEKARAVLATRKITYQIVDNPV